MLARTKKDISKLFYYYSCYHFGSLNRPYYDSCPHRPSVCMSFSLSVCLSVCMSRTRRS